MIRLAPWLLLSACATEPPAALPVEHNPLPQTFQIDMDDPLFPGQPVTILVTDAPPNSRVRLIMSDGEFGPGDCPDELLGGCMDITEGPSGYHVVMVPLFTNAFGTAVFAGTIPDYVIPGHRRVFQAVHVPTLTVSEPIRRDVGVLPCYEDAFEDNDSQATASPMVPGEPLLATACQGESDWYTFEGLAGEFFDGSVDYEIDGGNVDARLWDSNGNPLSQADFNYTSPDLFDAYQLTSDGTYYVEVFLDPAEPSELTGADYELDVELVNPNACVVDAFEPNDVAAEATPLTPGLYTDLGACYYLGTSPEDRFDWYAVDVQRGDTLSVDALFAHDEGDIDLYLFDFAQDNGRIDQGYLRRAFTSDDDESFTYVAPANATLYVVARVFADAGSTIDDGNAYDLDVRVTPMP